MRRGNPALPGSEAPEAGAPEARVRDSTGRRWSRAGEMSAGFVYGTVLWLWFTQLVGNPLLFPMWDELAPGVGGVCALVAPTRARAALLAGGIGVLLLTYLIAGTPLVRPAALTLIERDSLGPADAVVVLSSDIQNSGEPTTIAFERIIRGLEVLRSGNAPLLVLTRLQVREQSYVPAVRAQMRRLGLEYPILETERVRNTHDEALAVAAIARERGWRRIVLVTSALHSRRAAATFRKAGVPVLSAPSVEHGFDLSRLESPRDRIEAFKSWLHEAAGYEVYRRRGWL